MQNLTEEKEIRKEIRGDDKLFPLPANWDVGYMSDDGKRWHGQSREQEERLEKMRAHYKKRQLTDAHMAEEIERIINSEPSAFNIIYLHQINSGSDGYFIAWSDRQKAKIPLHHIEPPAPNHEFDGLADMVRKGWIWEQSPRAMGRPDWIEKDGFYYPDH